MIFILDFLVKPIAMKYICCTWRIEAVYATLSNNPEREPHALLICWPWGSKFSVAVAVDCKQWEWKLGNIMDNE